jgi:threonine dehydrogenase-like Zn-dependent dehydrogenase
MRFVRQLVFEEPGRVAWQEAPDPERSDGAGAIVRPLAVARCDLDPAMAAFGIFPGPYPVGHETVAEVVWTGGEVGSHAPGDRVLVPFQVSCGSCEACRDGRFAGCIPYRARAGAAFGFGESGGGHGGAVADLLAVPAAEHMLVAAPTGVSNAVLCTVPDNFIDAYRAVAPQLRERPGAGVLIVGGAAASIGLYAVSIARALGAGAIRYVDSDPERRAAAAGLGAETEEQPDEWPRRFERALITVDNTADAQGILTSIRSTEPYGVCTSVAVHFAPMTELPLLEMYTRGITFHLSRADSRRFLPEVLELVAAGTLDPAAIPTTTVPWDRADEAWMQPATKLVVERESG